MYFLRLGTTATSLTFLLSTFVAFFASSQPLSAQTGQNASILASSSAADSADVLYLKNGTILDGSVVGFSGAVGVAFRTANANAPRTVSALEIDRVEATVLDEFRQGVAAFENGRRTGDSADFQRALTFFQAARKTETRRWAKEWATAKIVDSLVALGRDDDAANEFLTLCRLDPYSTFLPSIPLRWSNRTAFRRAASTNIEEIVAPWLADSNNPTGASNPAGRLLAASILLNSTKYKNDAIAAMQSLVVLQPSENAAPDLERTCRMISLLATAQLWRLAALTTPTEREVDRWAQTLALFPNELRLGPTFMVARGFELLKRDSDAARLFLRVATLAQTNRELAEQATEAAAKIYERLGDATTAEKLRGDAQARFQE